MGQITLTDHNIDEVAELSCFDQEQLLGILGWAERSFGSREIDIPIKE